jgi:rSAM/selenodomain-associated transferase 2
MSIHRTLSVIIPAINEQDCIERAIRQAWSAGADQVILADGGSQDDTREIAAVHGATIVSSRPGRACQQNAGAAVATGDVLVFQHADNWFADHALAPLRLLPGTAATPLLGCFRQRLDHRHWLYRVIERGNAIRAQWLQLPYGDQGIYISRPLFHELGGFPDVPLMEDVLLMKQAKRRLRPVLQVGPLYVSTRRWEERGILPQTLRNWTLLGALHLGVSVERLAAKYPRHDQTRGAPPPESR